MPPVPAETLVAWLQRFVRHPSEQSELQESDPAVKAFIGECVAPLLQELGPVRFDGMGNLILELGSGGGGILFMTYAMTHPAASMPDPFAATIIDTADGPAIRGRGVAEQKTALAAVLGAITETFRDGLAGRVILAVTTAGETGRHDAAASVMKSLDRRPDHAVICLGTGGRIGNANKGRIDIDVTVHGRSTHSSMPSTGIDAIAGARRCLEALDAFEITVPEHPVLGPATLTPTAIRSFPEATHTLQDRVEMTFDRRLLPGESPDAAFEAISAALPSDGPCKVECRRGAFMYPNEVTENRPLMNLLRNAWRDAGLGEAPSLACSFALDAGYLGHLGIDSVMLGPGEIEQFHSSEEHVRVADMLDMARVYAELIRLSGKDAT